MSAESEHAVWLTVGPDGDGQRLDQYLCRRLHLSRTRVQKLIRQRLKSEVPLKPASIVRSGLRFALLTPRHQEPETPAYVPVLYQDRWVVVVDKPAGLPVHPSARYQYGTLVRRLAEQLGEEVLPVHRLDRETSGVLLCARSAAVARGISRCFQRGTVHKDYVAICEGHPVDDELEVDAPLALGGQLVRIAMRVDHASGRTARTRFLVVRRFERAGEPFALVRAQPLRGRQHQIRVHLQHAGYPIVGDKMYGPGEIYYDLFTRRMLDATAREKLRLPRHALHASQLSLPELEWPIPRCFRAPLPSDLQAFLDGLPLPAW